MNLFRSVGILGTLVVVGLVGCSSAANDAGRNTAPLAKDVTLSASDPHAHIGTTLQGGYRYLDTDADSESGTLKVWLRNGESITGADQDSYTATLADVGTKLQFRVTPASASGASPGAAVLSEEVTIENSPPSVTNVVIGGSVNGQADGRALLTVSYGFQDLDGDGEEASTYQWRRNGVAIGKATKDAYTPTLDDAGTTLTVAVKPFAHTGASPGLEVVSNPIKVATTNVELSVSAGLKQLHFSWYSVTKATYYRVSYNPDGVSGFVPLAKDSSALTGTSYDWDIALHRINWPKAQFMLEACDVTCAQSASISALNVMLDALGYFKAGNTEAGDEFGYSVALSADGLTLAVGANGEGSASTGVTLGAPTEAATGNGAAASGAVYVYTRNGAAWSQQAYVKASNSGANDGFGSSVALSADGLTLAVGAPGEDSAATGIGGKQSDDCTATSRLNCATNSGAVYVYTRSGATWTQQAYVKASNTGAYGNFGVSVALNTDGLTLAVGAYGEASANTGITSGAPSETTTGNGARGSGAVYVYARSGTVWTQQAYMKASNTGANDGFGRSVALSTDGLTLAVGAYGEASANTGITSGAPDETATGNAAVSSGAVYVYTRSSGAWTQQAYVKASNTGAGDYFGTSVALSGDGLTLAVGAFGEDSANINGNPVDDCNVASPANCAINSGAVYVYIRSGITWTQHAYLKASNTGIHDHFGSTIALSGDGDTLAVGAYAEGSAKSGVIPGAPAEAVTPNDASGTSSGAVYLFTRSSAVWSQQAYVKASNTGTGDAFGQSVALSRDGSTLAVGAYLEASAATGVNNTAPGQGDNSAPLAGAVYLY